MSSFPVTPPVQLLFFVAFVLEALLLNICFDTPGRPGVMTNLGCGKIRSL